MRVPDEVLEEIKSRISIVDVVAQHVSLKRTGKNWKGLCPFHSEKTPSFVVSEDRNAYHCFGCGCGGSAFNFLMEAEGLTFLEAVKVLAAKAGIVLEFSGEGKDASARSEQSQLRALLDLASRYYRHQLTNGRAGAEAREYLSRRNVPDDAAENFNLGYAPGGWDALTRYLKKKGADLSLSAKAGLIVEKTSGKGFYDRLRNRLVFPISDSNGRVVSFGGRSLDGSEPKYLNGPESPVFIKSEVLYGLHQAIPDLRTSRRALFVEGYLDVLRLHSSGFRTALASLGTALTAAHLRILRRRADEVVLIYDGDDAGKKAAFRSLDLFLAEGFPCRCVILPENHDPDSFIDSGGDLASLISSAESLFEACLEDAVIRFDATRPEGKLAGAEFMIKKLSSVSDPLAFDVYAKRVGEVFNLSEKAVRGRMRGGRDRRKENGPNASLAKNDDPLDRAVLECLLYAPAERARFIEGNLQEHMRSGRVRGLIDFVARRVEPAATFPIDAAPDDFRDLLSELLIEDRRASPPFDILEAKLKLRSLKERASNLTGDIRAAEESGDMDKVSILLREKTQIDKEKSKLENAVNQRISH